MGDRRERYDDSVNVNHPDAPPRCRPLSRRPRPRSAPLQDEAPARSPRDEVLDLLDEVARFWSLVDAGGEDDCWP